MAPLEGDYLVFRGVKAKAALSTLSSLPGKKIVPEPEKRMMVWVPGSQGSQRVESCFSQSHREMYSS